jgi:hypothetical protein
MGLNQYVTSEFVGQATMLGEVVNVTWSLND